MENFHCISILKNNEFIYFGRRIKINVQVRSKGMLKLATDKVIQPILKFSYLELLECPSRLTILFSIQHSFDFDHNRRKMSSHTFWEDKLFSIF